LNLKEKSFSWNSKFDVTSVLIIVSLSSRFNLAPFSKGFRLDKRENDSFKMILKKENAGSKMCQHCEK